MMPDEQYMLIFALGPVQMFIEQARKTRDLWVGSLLLSMLMEAAMQDIEGNFVFPARRTVGTIPDIPNKYVALFPSAQIAQHAAEQSRKQIKARWDSICQIVRDQIIADYHYGDQTTDAIWQRQTDFEHVFEVYWAIVPEKAEYKAWLKRAEQILSARKRLRDFQPQDEPGEKSAISGEREVLHRTQGDSKSVQQFWKDVVTWRSPRDIDKEGNEHLDSIDTIKRFATSTTALQQKQAFPSTSSIATASFVESLLSVVPDTLEPQIAQRWRKALEEWDRVTKSGLSREAMENIPFLFSLSEQVTHKDRQWLLKRDGDLYFPATFTPHRLKKDYAIADQDTGTIIVRNCKDALRKLLNAATEQHIAHPTPYYGIIQMDGDHMGKLLSNARDPQRHQAISQALSTFAHEKALRLVEREYPARLVYAGGDDVLAFAPLARDMRENEQPRNILELADQLQLHYTATVSAELELQEGKQAPKATASIGIAIAHHLTSLSYALRSVRDAEQAAKKRYDRNALVVTLLRRSGEQTQVGCHWHYPKIADPTGQPIKLFTRFYTLFKEDILSPRCVYFLLEEAPALVGLPPQAQASEVKRVLLRQLTLSRQNEKQQKDLKEEMIVLAGHIAALAEAMDAENSAETMTTELHMLQRRYGLVEVFGWLLVMAFLARKDRDQE